MQNSATNSIYLPRIIDRAVLGSGIDYTFVVFDAHIVIFLNRIFKEFVEKFGGIVIDPVTHFLQFSTQREKTSYQQLPYAGVTDIARLHSEPNYRLNDFIRPVVDFQVENDADILIAPYLCSEDIHSTIFTTNLTLLGETITNVERRGESIPIFAPICIGADAVKNKLSLNAVVDFYTDDSILEKIGGYYLMVSGFNDRRADIDELLGVADLVYQLSRKKTVIVKQIGAFGLVLSVFTNTAFTSSPAQGETFSLSHYKTDFAISRNHNEWMYVPELLDYVNEFELSPSRINYQCSCYACTSPQDFDSKSKQRKIHFLIRRQEDVARLKRLDQNDRVKYLTSRMETAISQATDYISRFNSDLSTSHIHNWKDVLSQAKTWDHEATDKELEDILKAIEEL